MQVWCSGGEYWCYMMMLVFNSKHFFLCVKMHIGI